MRTERPTVVEQKSTDIEQGVSSLTIAQVAEERSKPITEERIYEESAKVAAIFWEWRHKIMTHFFGGIAALIALIGWLYQQAGGFRVWFCAPLLLGAVFSLVSYLLDKRNTRILRECYRIGTDLELQTRKEGGIFSFISGLHYTKGSYTQILHAVYLTSTILLLGLSILIIIVVW